MLEYKQFYPFCKAHSDVKTMECHLLESRWEIQADKMVFYISANRFLRGMVRLIVGMCLRVSTGDIQLGTIKDAMDRQTRLERAWSVPAHGLFLTGINYPADILKFAPKT